MKKIEHDFEMDQYGLHVRLVNENDAEFILSLRTDPILTKYLHETENNLTKQLEWIRAYKKREEVGLDYYFIYSYENHNIGVNRIYNITNNTATAGSWVCKKGLDIEQVVPSLLILRNIIFDVLEKEKDLFQVSKGNNHVLKLHKMMGATIIMENEEEYLLELKKDVYRSKRDYLVELLNIK